MLLSLWCLLGFVFYWRTIRRGALTEYSGISASGTVLFALLVYSALMWLAKRLAAKDSLAKKETSAEAMRAYLDKIDTSGKHLLSLLNDLLEMSRIESGNVQLQYEPADLCRTALSGATGRA